MPEKVTMPIHLRSPQPPDGPAIHRLIAHCPPLDANSLYCNLLQCSYFASTCVLAQRAEHIVGFVSGFRVPQQPETLFVWQVAVASEARGQGLGVRMLEHLLRSPGSAGVNHLQTTVTPSNAASLAMFTTLARRLSAPLTNATLFDRHVHFAGAHESELLVTIGPLQLSPAVEQCRTVNEENT